MITLSIIITLNKIITLAYYPEVKISIYKNKETREVEDVDVFKRK